MQAMNRRGIPLPGAMHRCLQVTSFSSRHSHPLLLDMPRRPQIVQILWCGIIFAMCRPISPFGQFFSEQSAVTDVGGGVLSDGLALMQNFGTNDFPQAFDTSTPNLVPNTAPLACPDFPHIPMDDQSSLMELGGSLYSVYEESSMVFTAWPIHLPNPKVTRHL